MFNWIKSVSSPRQRNTNTNETIAVAVPVSSATEATVSQTASTNNVAIVQQASNSTRSPHLNMKGVENTAVRLEPSSSERNLFNTRSSIEHTMMMESHFDEEGARVFLKANNWPTGLQDVYIESLKSCPQRFFIVDDSGSMNTSDATRLIRKADSAVPVVCTRWSELVETVKFHAQLANAAKCVTEFRLLNNHPPLTIGSSSDSSELTELFTALKEPPNGSTPLCRHINEIVDKITVFAPSLVLSKKKVKLIVATDGEASDGNLADAMRPLRDLPVWIVVRLCTSNETISKYWADIDAELELNMDVVQSLPAEAAEIMAYNSWLNYSEPLHRLRESGLSLKEVDLLDETKLTGEQIVNIVALIFGANYKETLTHPDVDMNAFIATLKDAEEESTPALNPITRHLGPHIDIRALRHHLGKSLLRSFGDSFFLKSSRSLRGSFRA